MVSLVAGCWRLWRCGAMAVAAAAAEPRRPNPAKHHNTSLWRCVALAAAAAAASPADPTSKAPQHTKQHHFDRTQPLNHSFKPKSSIKNQTGEKNKIQNNNNHTAAPNKTKNAAYYTPGFNCGPSLQKYRAFSPEASS